jgi:hypothetical protein
MRTSVIGVVIATVVLIGARADAQTARAELENAEGKIVGTATLEQQGNDVRIVATFTGLPAGTARFTSTSRASAIRRSNPRVATSIRRGSMASPAASSVDNEGSSTRIPLPGTPSARRRA